MVRELATINHLCRTGLTGIPHNRIRSGLGLFRRLNERRVGRNTVRGRLVNDSVMLFPTSLLAHSAAESLFRLLSPLAETPP